jgi:hypothetical protein
MLLMRESPAVNQFSCLSRLSKSRNWSKFTRTHVSDHTGKGNHYTLWIYVHNNVTHCSVQNLFCKRRGIPKYKATYSKNKSETREDESVTTLFCTPGFLSTILPASLMLPKVFASSPSI